MKKCGVFSVTLCFLFCLWLIAPIAIAAEKTVVIGLTGEAQSLDPYVLNEVITNAVNKHIFDSLTTSDRNLQPLPALAEKWESSENALVWTLHLRKGVKFHNGNDFTADDVIFTFERSQREGQSAFAFCLAGVNQYKKVDDYTVQLTCEAPNPLLISHLGGLRVLDKESCEGRDDDWIALNPNGTGRYTVLEHVRGDRLVLKRNEGYWGDKPEAEKVIFKPLTNAGTRTANLLSGAVDLITDVSVRDVDMLKANKDITVVSMPSLRVIYLNFSGWIDHPSKDAPMPLKSPDGSNPLKKRSVREAIYRAINEDEIIEKIMNGYAKPAATYVSEGVNGHNPDVQRLAYDPKTAENLLDAAGYPRQKDGYRFEITLDAPNDRYVNDAAIAGAVASYLEKVGIKVNLNLMSRSIFFTYISPSNQEGDKTHFCMTGWADSAGESVLLAKDLLYSYGHDGKPVKAGFGEVNRGYYVNPEVDRLIDKALTSNSFEERGTLMKQVWQTAAEEVAYIPLHFQEDLYAYGKRIVYHPRKDKFVYAWDVEFK